jgi:hypothetical protein
LFEAASLKTTLLLERMTDKKTKQEEKARRKTFNRLDIKFQVDETLDPNHVFEEEKQMLQTLKEDKRFAQLDDKVLLCFLFARRHSLKETKALLTNHLDVRDKQKFDQKFPVVDDCRKTLEKGFSVRRNGSHDKYGRTIAYYFIEKDEPKERDIRDFWNFFFWDSYDQIKHEPLKVLRNGSIIVVDMENFGWKNIDLSSKGRESNKALNNVFPKRIRKMYVVNQGPLFSAAFTAAKLVLPKKLVKRVQIITHEELLDLIPEHSLHPKYGGKLDVSIPSE